MLSTKFIKPSIPTPLNLRHYKIGFTDEFAPVMSVSIALFFSIDSDNNPKFVAQLEKSLEKTLTRFYPLAGRYVEEIHTVDCNDQGVEFIRAQVNIKLQDFLDFEFNSNLVDKFIPSKSRVADRVTDPILATQVTTFQCGGVALGVSISHRIVDASTLGTFLNEWATISREENESGFIRLGFHSSSLFPTLGLTPLDPRLVGSRSNDFPSMNNVMKKLSFSGTVISNMKAKAMLNGKFDNRQLSRVQLVSGLIWEIIIDVDRAIHNYSRDSVLIQTVNLREKTASSIPKNSFGNLWGLLLTECKTGQGLAYLLRDSVKNVKNNYSKVCLDSDEGQTMVLNSFSQITNIPSTTDVIWLSSWCNFPFYEADFGFGKPVWANHGSWLVKNLVYLMDDVEGNGVEAYVCMEKKDVPYFEQILNLKGFAIGISGV